MYAIEYTAEAFDDLESLRKFEQKQIMRTVVVSTHAKTLNALLKRAQEGGLMKLLDARGKQTKTFTAAEVRAKLGLPQMR